MNDQNAVMTLPAFGDQSPISLDIGKTREAETRLIEAKMVNPSTYNELEHCFNESYRELKQNISKIGFQITKAQKALEDAKAHVILDTLPEYMKDKAKSWDSSDLRKALMTRDPAYIAAQDRIDMLKAMESHTEGKIKVMERVCAYMKVQMNLIIRSGISTNLYNTQGNR